MHPPFDRLRANGSGTEIVKDFPFVLSLSKHERRLPATSHLGKLYYRTGAQAEIDLVMEGPRRRIVAVEIKRTLAPKVSKGFYLGCEDIGATERYYVIPDGERYPLGHDAEAIALSELVQLLGGAPME